MRTFLKGYFRTRYIDRFHSPRRLKRFQNKSLKRLLTVARETAPLQAERIRSFPINLGDIEPTDKDQMMDRMTDSVDHRMLKKRGLLPEDLTDFLEHYGEKGSPIFDDFFVLSETSGTSGNKGLFWRTRKELGLRDGIKLAREGGPRALAKYLKKEQIRKAILYSGEPFSSSHQNVEDLRRKFSRFIEICTFANDQTFEKIVEGLKEFNPHHIYGYPLILEQLAEYSLGHDVGLNPSVIRSGAAQLSQEARGTIAQAFPETQIINHYAATECAPIAGSCTAGKMHLFADSVVVECMSHLGKAVPIGEYSDYILVTSLTRSFQPIIRYKIEDQVRILPNKCSCGSILPLVEIRGRMLYRFKIVDNNQDVSTLTSPQFMDSFYQLPMVKEYQVRYEKKNHFRIHVYESEENVQLFEKEYSQIIDAHFQKLLVRNGCDETVTIELKYLPESQKNNDESAYYTFEQ